ncbi:MAG: hypothetical protein ACTH4Y_08025 [Microbacterium gubbeenense]|uniref:hypothetical protein n=1 Tax=Microbacterium gubbeenense TaxID=159896 RepID=UPI003F9B52FF
MRADLQQFYGIDIDDVWAGRVSARHVLILAHQLTAVPDSRVFALRGGTPQLQGWDSGTVIAARTHNLIVTLINGLSGKSGDVPDDLFIHYPGTQKKPVEDQPKTLADFSSIGFAKFMYGDE